MSEVSGDGGAAAPEWNGSTGVTATPAPPPLMSSASFKEGGGGRSSSRRRPVRPSFDADNEFMTLLHGSDPVKVELNRLENEVRGAKCGSIWRFVYLFNFLGKNKFVLFFIFFLLLLFADKDRELGEAQAEIKALRLSERLREKAVEEVNFIFLVCF